MTDQSWLLGAAAQELVVVVDDVGDADRGERRRRTAPQIGERNVFVGPRRRLDIVPARLETGGELVP